MLGDDTIALQGETPRWMLPIEAEVFSNTRVYLRVWFDDGVNGFQQLEPDQRVVAVGYAMQADTVPNRSITTEKLANGAVTSDKIGAGAIGTFSLANGAVTAGKFASNAVTSVKLVDGAVTGTKLDDNSVTAGTIANDAITAGKIADDAVTSSAFAVGAVTRDKLDPFSVGTSQIANESVTAPKIGNSAVIGSKIAGGAVESRHIRSAAVVGGKFAADTVAAEKLGSDAVGTPQLQSASITARKLAPGTAASNLKANGVGTVHADSMVLSHSPSDTALLGADYRQVGSFCPNLPYSGWREMKLDGMLGNRQDDSFVKVGRYAVYWGGTFTATTRNEVKVYDLLEKRDAFEANADGKPLSRYGQSAISTGTRMITWGGVHKPGGGPGTYLNDGAAYDPYEDGWEPLGPEGLTLEPRRYHSAVWTGSRMIVWGGENEEGDFFSDGAIYDPDSDTWSAMRPDAPDIPVARARHTAHWTGREMLIWGGTNDNGVVSDGAAFDPAEAETPWRPISSVEQPSARCRHASVWTGTELIVWGGRDAGQTFGDGARYNPATDTWRPLGAAGTPAPRYSPAYLWTGQMMLVTQGHTTDGPSDSLVTGGIYDPVADTWQVLRPAPSWSGANPDVKAIWTGTDAVFYKGPHESIPHHRYCPPHRKLYLYLR